MKTEIKNMKSELYITNVQSQKTITILKLVEKIMFTGFVLILPKMKMLKKS